MIAGITVGLLIIAVILIIIAVCVDGTTASDVLCILAIVSFVGTILMFIFRLFPWIY